MVDSSPQSQPFSPVRFADVDGILWFEFHAASHAAVDMMLDKLLFSLRKAPSNRRVAVLWDLSRIELPPLSYTFQRLQSIHRSLPKRPGLRAALIYRHASQTAFVDAFFQMMGTGEKDLLRFFAADEINAAAEWLQNAP